MGNTYNELKKASMAFQLKDGNIILISKEDIHEIAMKIIVEGSLMPKTVIIKESDRSVEKADMLYNILKTQKDMSQKVIEKYLIQISNLLGSSEKTYTDIRSKNEVEVKED